MAGQRETFSGNPGKSQFDQRNLQGDSQRDRLKHANFRPFPYRVSRVEKELGGQMWAQRHYGRAWEAATSLFFSLLKLLLFCERGENLSFKLSI